MTLTPEQQALSDRERARMAEPGYRDRLVDPPADLLRRRLPSSDIGDEKLATIERLHHQSGDECATCFGHKWPCPSSRLITALRACREQRGQAVEAMRLCMKDLQEFGVIFVPGDPPYDVLIAYDEESRP